jgi:hypothetical protein
MTKITRFYYRLLSILSEKLATFTITIAIGEKLTFGHPCFGHKSNELFINPSLTILVSNTDTFPKYALGPF